MFELKKYLERIGLDGDMDLRVDYETLKKIHYHHILSVPYENLDLVDGILVSMDNDKIYEKVVTRHRGGYCFELNGLFAHAMRSIGFKCESFLGRFLRGEEGIPLRRHRVAIVTIGDERYHCDVGMGQNAPRFPIKLVEEVPQEVCGETYKFRKDEILGWVLCDLYKGQWRDFYSFTEEFQTDEDFYLPSFYWERHPDSKFNKFPIVAVKTEGGRKTINDREFKAFQGKELIRIEENMSDERLREVLKEEFGIEWRNKNA